MYNAKLQYWSWENLIEWVTYISALLLVIDFDKCQGRTGLRQVSDFPVEVIHLYVVVFDLSLLYGGTENSL